MIKIYNKHKFKSRKDILGDYRAELIKRLKEAKKNEYPKFDETLSFSIYLHLNMHEKSKNVI